MSGECAICRIIRTRNDAEKDYLIAELETGYAVISNRWQCFRGYTLFLCKKCVSELHELPPDYRCKFLFEMSLVSEAVFNAFHPLKLNCELLGNACRPSSLAYHSALRNRSPARKAHMEHRQRNSGFDNTPYRGKYKPAGRCEEGAYSSCGKIQ